VNIRILSAMVLTLKIHSNIVGFINLNSIVQMQEALKSQNVIPIKFVTLKTKIH
jgi:hypothetical protein